MTGGAADGGRGVFRVRWVPGTDILRGTCHCGREHPDEDPVDMWAWMLTHRHLDESDGT